MLIMKKKIQEHIEFIYQYFTKPRKVGAIMPSSKYLARNIVEFIDFSKNNLRIVEYGPGTGPFTERIIRKLKEGDKLILIEQNSKFVRILKEKYSQCTQLVIVEESVINVAEILNSEKVDEVDYIISGIPFSSLPKKATLDIMEKTKNIMRDKSLFITFQYSTLKLNTFRKYFKILSKKFVFRNVPSAYIICMKKR